MSEEQPAQEIAPSETAGAAALFAATDAPPAAETPADGVPAAPWYNDISDVPAVEGKLSDKAWLENKKYADMPSLIKAARESEAQLLGGDKLIIPKEGDAPEAFERFYTALGRPETPEGYKVELGKGEELDEAFAGTMMAAAHKLGLSQNMFAGLVGPFNEYIQQASAEQQDLHNAAKVEGAASWKKEQGGEYNSSVAAANVAMRALNLDAAGIGAIEDGFEARFPGEGTKRVMDLFVKLGKGMGEDILAGAGGAPKFGISAASAQVELDKYASDKELGDKIRSGDAEHVARRKMLMQVVAQTASKS